MDAGRFDYLSKLVSRDPTRRQMLAGLLGGALTALALAPAAAKKKKKGKKKGGGGVCAAATGKCQPECTFDTECGLFGKLCEGNKCVDGCRNDTYCRVISATHVEVCERGQCVRGCPDNEFQCPPGTLCIENHHCLPPCIGNNDCPSTQVCHSNGKCGRACTSPDDCPPGQGCRTGGICRPGCRTHSDCPDCRLCDMEGNGQCYVYDPVCCANTPGCS